MMLKNGKYKMFMEEFAEDFDLFLDREKVNLAKIDPEYQEMLVKIEKMKKKNPRINALFNEETRELSEQDCEDLQTVISLQYRMLKKEYRAMFLKGSREVFLYFQEIEKFDDFK